MTKKQVVSCDVCGVEITDNSKMFKLSSDDNNFVLSKNDDSAILEHEQDVHSDCASSALGKWLFARREERMVSSNEFQSES